MSEEGNQPLVISGGGATIGQQVDPPWNFNLIRGYEFRSLGPILTHMGFTIKQTRNSSGQIAINLSQESEDAQRIWAERNGDEAENPPRLIVRRSGTVIMNAKYSNSTYTWEAEGNKGMAELVFVDALGVLKERYTSASYEPTNITDRGLIIAGGAAHGYVGLPFQSVYTDMDPTTFEISDPITTDLEEGIIHPVADEESLTQMKKVQVLSTMEALTDVLDFWITPYDESKWPLMGAINVIPSDPDGLTGQGVVRENVYLIAGASAGGFEGKNLNNVIAVSFTDLPPLNSLLVVASDGTTERVKNDESIEHSGRYEAVVNAPTGMSLAAATNLANDTLRPGWQVSFTFKPNPVLGITPIPFVDYGVGDWVGIRVGTGVYKSNPKSILQRILSIEVTVSPEGEETQTIIFDTPAENRGFGGNV